MLEKNTDSEVHVEKIEQRPTASIAFGLDHFSQWGAIELGDASFNQ